MASTRTAWGLPEVRLGIIPSGGGLWRLPRLVGWSAATDLVVTGRRIHGTTAQQIGLVTRLVEDDALEDTLTILVDELGSAESRAQRLAKEAMWAGPNRGRLFDALAQSASIEHADAQQRLAAFLQR